VFSAKLASYSSPLISKDLRHARDDSTLGEFPIELVQQLQKALRGAAGCSRTESALSIVLRQNNGEQFIGQAVEADATFFGQRAKAGVFIFRKSDG